ncbi:monofunctional biosynthetic peptidoglycan transglycosylase, partial [Yersinia enterocolitica]|nr:monofunctional biosynthetic peptidoglycan transglycosylase [Yersinia enterocolitica]
MISVRRGLNWLWYWGKRAVIGIVALWLAGILIFAFLPVPFSMVMIERQLGAWLTG